MITKSKFKKSNRKSMYVSIFLVVLLIASAFSLYINNDKIIQGFEISAATVEPSNIPTEEPSPTPDYLPDFIPPQAEYEMDENAYIEEQRAKAEKSNAAAGIVQIDNIDSERDFAIYDLVHYAAYLFFGLAIVAILYGIICMGALLFFKKDITIDALRKKRRAKKKIKVKVINEWLLFRFY